MDEFGGDGPASTWSVGELADATGLTVRTLRHYDETCLVTPSLRNHAGHRRYTVADVQRLHRVAALRGFGLALPEIGRLLDEATGGTVAAGSDVREIVQRQLDQVEDRIERACRLRERLDAVLAQLDSAGGPSASALIGLIEAMTAVEHAYQAEETDCSGDR